MQRSGEGRGAALPLAGAGLGRGARRGDRGREEAVAEAIDELERRLDGGRAGRSTAPRRRRGRRWPRTPRRRRPRAGCSQSRGRRRSPRRRPRCWRSSPICSRCRVRRSPGSAASRRIRRYPASRERGMIEERGRSQLRGRHLRDHAAVREALRPLGPRCPARSGPVRSDARGRARAARAPAQGG